MEDDRSKLWSRLSGQYGLGWRFIKGVICTSILTPLLVGTFFSVGLVLAGAVVEALGVFFGIALYEWFFALGVIAVGGLPIAIIWAGVYRLSRAFGASAFNSALICLVASSVTASAVFWLTITGWQLGEAGMDDVLGPMILTWLFIAAAGLVPVQSYRQVE